MIIILETLLCCMNRILLHFFAITLQLLSIPPYIEIRKGNAMKSSGINFLALAIVACTCVLPQQGQAIEITNPYVRIPSSPNIPSIRPHYRAGKPAPRYHPGTIEMKPQDKVDTGPNVNHIEWCRDRFRSYRTRDNSYRPLGGGGRRTCSSPFSP